MNTKQTRRSFIKTVSMSLVASGMACSALKKSKPPNVVIIFLDDSGWSDFKPYGKPSYSTPHVEQLAKEGLDIPDLDTLVMTSSIGELGALEQSIGRILRKFYDGNINPVVFDLVDMCGNFPRHAGERRKYYVEEGYPVDIFKLKLNANNRKGIATTIDTYVNRLLISDAQDCIKRVEKKNEKKKQAEELPQGVCLLD